MTVLIVGLGQIGGSIALSLRRNKSVERVIGYDKKRSVTSEALRRRIIHQSASSISAGLRNADLVIIAAPIRQTIKLLPDLAKAIPAENNPMIIDVAGSKTEIMNLAASLGLNFVGGHPLTGTEQSGLDSVSYKLFEHSVFVLTPQKCQPTGGIKVARSFVKALGANPLVMSSEEHDRLISVTSHLPYLLAVTLSDLASDISKKDKKMNKLTAGSFESATRVAASPVELTLDMFLTNRTELCSTVHELIDRLTQMKHHLKDFDEEKLRYIISRAHRRAKQANRKR